MIVVNSLFTAISVEKLVVIPTYNERENISNILHAIFNLAEGFHVLVIDDGSPDGTAEDRKRIAAKIFRCNYLLKKEEANRV